MRLQRKSSEGRKNIFEAFGRRGAILSTMGAVWILLGVSTLISGPAPGTENLIQFPNVVSSWLWIISGVIAIFYAPTTDDAVGFLALYIMPALKGLSALLGFLDYITTSVGTDGYARGAVSFLFYAVMIVFIIICAGWPEPPKTPNEVFRGEADAYLHELEKENDNS